MDHRRFVFRHVIFVTCLLVLLPAFSSFSGVADVCPRACFCNTASKIVYCSRRGLSSIPDGIPEDSLQLNLNGNRFESRVIRRTNFSQFTTALEHLYMSECSIQAIEVNAFGEFQNLQWLDLSNNQLKLIHENTFQGLNLQHLFLNGNRNIHLLPGSFDGLVTTGLYLHDCSISRIKPEVLDPLNSTLRYLWLNGNELEKLDRRFSELFSRLLHLRLGTNPLHCGCESLWLKEFFDRNSDTFKGALPPSCLTPIPLKGRYFSELSLADVRCQMPQFRAVDAVFDGNGQGRLRCVAVGEPTPVLYWIQPSGKTARYNSPSDDSESRNVATLTLSSSDIDQLIGMYICIANNEAGNVTLTINIPHPQSMLENVFNSAESSKVHPYQVDIQTPADADSPLLQLGDSLVMMQTSTLLPSIDVKQNYTELDLILESPADFRHNPDSQDVSRLFTVGQLAWAIVGTHICTLLMCLLVAIGCYRRCRTAARLKQHRDMDSEGIRSTDRDGVNYCRPYTDDGTFEKLSSMSSRSTAVGGGLLSESVYLNGLPRHQPLRYYMDSPPSSTPLVLR